MTSVTLETPKAPVTSLAGPVSLTLSSGWESSWNSYLAVKASEFKAYESVLTGNKIVIAFTGASNLGIYAGASEYNGGTTIRKTSGYEDTSWTFEVTEAIKEKLLSGGLYIALQDATLSSVTLSADATPTVEAASTDPTPTPAATPTTPPTTPTTPPVLPANLEISSGWTKAYAVNLAVAADKLAPYENILSGAILTIEFEVDDGEAGSNFSVVAGGNPYSGQGYSLLHDHLITVDDNWQPTVEWNGWVGSSATSQTVTIPSGAVEKLVSGGLYIGLQNATLTSVTITQ